MNAEATSISETRTVQEKSVETPIIAILYRHIIYNLSFSPRTEEIKGGSVY